MYTPCLTSNWRIVSPGILCTNYCTVSADSSLLLNGCELDALQTGSRHQQWLLPSAVERILVADDSVAPGALMFPVHSPLPRIPPSFNNDTLTSSLTSYGTSLIEQWMEELSGVFWSTLALFKLWADKHVEHKHHKRATYILPNAVQHARNMGSTWLFWTRCLDALQSTEQMNCSQIVATIRSHVNMTWLHTKKTTTFVQCTNITMRCRILFWSPLRKETLVKVLWIYTVTWSKSLIHEDPWIIYRLFFTKTSACTQ